MDRTRRALAVLVVLIGILGWLGVVHPELPSGTHSAPAPVDQVAAATYPVLTHLGAGSGPAALAADDSSNLAAGMAERAVEATRALGLPANVIYVPHPSASPVAVALAREVGAVSPYYVSDPAPMGVADYGLSGTGTGPLTASVLNTTDVRGFVDLNRTGAQGLDLYQSTPDAFSIQLNAVLTNVMLFGHGGYSFWTQDVVTYYPATHYMILVSNVWNFSGRPISANALYSHGPFGTNAYGTLGYYFAEDALSTQEEYPFNLTLEMNSTVAPSGRNAVYFAVSLSSNLIPSEDFAVNFDTVQFNSTSAARPHGTSVPSNYTANGRHYNPIDLTDDIELDICGPGAGSQVDLGTADANLGLAYLTSNGHVVAVPSAFNYGSDTGETATGANVAWSDAGASAPGGLKEFATMTTGPSILSGLWGLGAPEGSDPVALDVMPANAFNFLSYNGSTNFTGPFDSHSVYAPNVETHTFHLMPGQYRLLTELADHTFQHTTLVVPGTPVVTVALGSDTSLGIYTPLWAFSNPEVTTLAQSGAGTPADPYVMYNSQPGTLSSDFGLYNDFGFPVFPGVFLYGTNVTTVFRDSPSFVTATSVVQYPGSQLPGINDPQYWFWQVHNVAILGARNVSGWFASKAIYPLTFNSFNVIFYESSDNLVAGSSFPTDSEALLFYSGGTIYGPTNLLGGNNTVWGNQFVETYLPPFCPDAPACLALFPFHLGLGLEVAEDHDLVYNNLFATPTTAWLLPMNLYSGRPELFAHESWNITPQPASNVRYTAGFPTIPLSGSIVGGATQAGNSWWDYGLLLNWYNGADNPLTLLPYLERATTLISQLPQYGCLRYYCATYLYPGGDYAPLTTESAPVLLSEQGLATGEPWGGVVTCAPSHLGGGNTSTASPCCAPTHLGGGNTSSASPCCAPTHLGGGNTSASGPCCAPTHLGGGNTSASCGGAFVVAIFTTTARTFNLGSLPDGYYNWTPILPPGYASTSGGTFRVLHHAVSLVARSHVAPGYSVVTVRERGLPKQTPWELTLSGTDAATDAFNASLHLTGTKEKIVLADGTYTFRVGAPPGYRSAPSNGSFSVTGRTHLRIAFRPNTYPVTFSESGLAGGVHWTVRMVGPLRGSGRETEQLSATNATILLDLPNGSYTYSVLAPSGTNCTALAPLASHSHSACASGNLSVAGRPVVVNLSFDRPAGASAPRAAPAGRVGAGGSFGAPTPTAASRPRGP
jgi:Thermopsin